MTWLQISLRRLRSDRATAVGLAVLVGISAFAAAATPRVLTTVADDALRGELAQAPVAQRGLAFGEEGRLGAELGAVDARGRAIVAELPASLRDRLAAPQSLVESARWVATTAVKTPGTVRFRFQPGAMSRVTFTEGRPPTDATTESTATRLGSDEPVTVVHFEGALSSASAEQLGVAIGDDLELSADPADRLGRLGQGDVTAMTVVGVFVVTDPSDDFWFDDRALVAPTVRDVNANLSYVDATALLADEAYPPFMTRSAGDTPLRHSWRLAATVDALDATSAAVVAAELRRVESRYPTVAATIGDVTSSTGLRTLLERQADRWRVAEAVLAILVVGAAAVALSALGLVARMLAGRRRVGLALSLGRGATRSQLLASAMGEGMVLSAPAGLVGLVAAMAVLPAGDMRASAAAAGAVVLVAALVVTFVTVSAAVRLREAATPDGTLDPTPGRRRAILEGSFVAFAVLGVVLLRSRGLSAGTEALGTGVRPPAVDPLMAVVPALAGLAAGIVALRAVRVPLRLLDRAARLRRGLASALAIRRLSRGNGAGAVLLVLLGTASIATFSSALFAHVDRAAAAVSWQAVGAPYRVSGSVGRLPARFDPSALPGVTASAGAFRASVPIGDRGSQVDLLALDVADYAAVVAGTPAADTSAGRFDELRQAVVPATADPTILPVIITPALAIGPEELAVGDPVSLSIEGVRVRGEVRAIREDLPTLPVGGRAALIPRDAWPLETPPPSTTTVFLRAPAGTGAELSAAVTAAVPGARLDDRAAAEDAIRAAPIAQAVRGGVAAAVAIAAAYAVLAVAVALALTGAARAVESAHLRLLGLGPRDALLLVLFEYGPLVGVAFVMGVALGTGLFLVVRPALGLEVIVGSEIAVPIGVSSLDVVLSLAAVLAVAAVGIGLGAMAERRAMTSGAIRLGIERP